MAISFNVHNKILAYNYEKQLYEWVPYSKANSSEYKPSGTGSSSTDIGGSTSVGPSPEEYSRYYKESDGADVQGFESPQGDIFGASAALDAFSTGLDVVSAGSPMGVAAAAASSIGDITGGFERASKLTAAMQDDANINELLGGYQSKATIGDILGNIASAAVGAFTGNPLGTIGGLVGLASDISSFGVGDKALERAAAMEQELAQSGMVAGRPASYGFGYSNTVANFQAQQAKNLAAVQTDEERELAPSSAMQTIGDVLGSATGFSGYSGGYSNLSYGGFNDRGTTGTSGSMGGYETEATNPGAAGSLGGEGAGAGDVGGGFSGGGMSGGFGSGDTGSASETGAEVGGGNIA